MLPSILQMGLELEVAAYLLFLCNKAANHQNNLRIEKSRIDVSNLSANGEQLMALLCITGFGNIMEDRNVILHPFPSFSPSSSA